MSVECGREFDQVPRLSGLIHKAARTEAVVARGGFVAKANFPGFNVPGQTDHGFGPLAVVVESLLAPGTLIKFHEHVQDEIVSWVPHGVMRHDDRVGGQLVIDAGHLMVMNAGRSFWHEERTLEHDPPLRMLQIFVRPRADDLDPNLQYGPLPDQRPGQWRHVFGPEGSPAPFHVRNAVHCYDAALAVGATTTLPTREGWATYFYVFEGCVEANGQMFDEAESGLVQASSGVELRAVRATLIVAFVIDPAAPAQRTGSVGDGETVRAGAALMFAARR